MQVYARTHKGMVRQTNQDTMLIRDNLFGVADGMGGHLGGETASKLAVQVIENMLANKLPSETVLRIGVEAANRRVFERQRYDFALRGMGTTLTILWENGEQVFLAHVGDSRAYLLRDGKLKCITQDHSVVGEMIRDHAITPEEAKTHPYRSVITRAIGTSPIVDADVLEVKKKPGDVWLICSDGLFNMLEDPEIEHILLESKEDKALDKLLELTLERGAEDNVSVLLGYVPEVTGA
ncbi:MAG: Stp1/IreP family PP2C-type Ser/Thr phosphatase [Firmicutes bacterium]|nr:Stp1/IreP family PP2C-type Ser/Thr phosphatase [Bacillota bacterium]